MLTIQNYRKVESLSEAYELNQKKSNRIIGGMLWLRLGNARIQTAIDLSGLGLDGIEETEEEFRIGAMTTLRSLELHPGFAAYTGGCAGEALRHIVGVQFRNLATVGGSLYGRYGFSDVLTLLLALDSHVELYRGGVVPLQSYAGQAYDRDILVRVIVKKKPVRMFYEAVRITKTDLPVLTCAAARFLGEEPPVVCIGARPGRAILAGDPLHCLENGVTAEKIAAYAGSLQKSVTTGGNLRAGAGYRSHLVGVLSRRALQSLYFGEGSGTGCGVCLKDGDRV